MSNIENLNGAKATFLPINTDWVLNQAMQEIAAQGLQFEQRGVIHSRAQHKVEILLPELVYNDGDSNLTARIVLSNANNGTRAFNIAVGFLRLICSNGLVIGVNAFSERIIHRNTERTVERVNELPEKVAKALEFLQSGEAFETMAEMQSIKLNERQGIEVIGSLGIATSVKDRSIAQWIDYDRRRLEDRANNLYSLFNITNEALRRIHGPNSVVYHRSNDKLMDEVTFLAANVR